MSGFIYRTPVSFGCDPELFFATAKGKIVGAERVLPESGELGSGDGIITALRPKAFVLDGVQAELNPHPSLCRATLGYEIQASFKALKAHLKGLAEKGEDVKACFDAVVKVDKAEMDRLSEKSKQFGCLPSLNRYDSKSHVMANAAKYRKRSAGGHIHLGFSAYKQMMEHRERLIPIMDALIGNTCVLIDRNPEAVERRKYYGRAGEYRLPPHGIEYRTLSNFWLQSYPLFHLVMGLSRLAVGVLNTTLIPSNHVIGGVQQVGWNAEADLMQRVDLKKIRAAINGNDLKLATENWQGVKEFIQANVNATAAFRQEVGIDTGNVDAFEFFANKVQKEGMGFWFPDDPLDHWTKIDLSNGGVGWEAFTTKTIRPRMLEEGK